MSAITVVLSIGLIWLAWPIPEGGGWPFDLFALFSLAVGIATAINLNYNLEESAANTPPRQLSPDIYTTQTLDAMKVDTSDLLEILLQQYETELQEKT